MRCVEGNTPHPSRAYDGEAYDGEASIRESGVDDRPPGVDWLHAARRNEHDTLGDLLPTQTVQQVADEWRGRSDAALCQVVTSQPQLHCAAALQVETHPAPGGRSRETPGCRSG
jgi:hypothetical protein